jgi:hypothetical protein
MYLPDIPRQDEGLEEEEGDRDGLGCTAVSDLRDCQAIAFAGAGKQPQTAQLTLTSVHAIIYL